VPNQIDIDPADIATIIDLLIQQGVWNQTTGKISDQHNDFRQGAFYPVYQWIFSHIIAPNQAALTAGTYMWFSKAPFIHNGDPNDSSALYVRGATQYGLDIRGKIGGYSNDSVTTYLNRTSDVIASRVIQQILDSKGIVDFNTMLKNDIATSVQDSLLGDFQQDAGGWGGTFYYWNATLDSKSLGSIVQSSSAAPGLSMLDEFLYANSSASADTAHKIISTFNTGVPNVVLEFAKGIGKWGDYQQAATTAFEAITAGLDAQTPGSIRLTLVGDTAALLIGRALTGESNVGAHLSDGVSLAVTGSDVTFTYADGKKFALDLEHPIGSVFQTWLTSGTEVDWQIQSSGAIALSTPPGAAAPETALIAADGSIAYANGDGARVVLDASGHDVLYGRSGSNSYVIGAMTGANASVVIDDVDGNGSLTIGSTVVATAGAVAGSQPFTWTDSSGASYRFAPMTNGADIGKLFITGGVAGSGRIELDNFDLNQAETAATGFLGIKLGEQAAIVAGNGADPFAAGSNQAADASATLTGAVQGFTVYTSAAGAQAQTIQLSLSGADASQYKVNTGADVLAFDGSGKLTLTIPAGEESVTVGLVYVGDSSQSPTVQLTSSLLDSASPASNKLTVTFDNSHAPSAPVFGTLTSITGEVVTTTVNGQTSTYVQYQGDDSGDLVTATDNATHSITVGQGSSSITGGAGEDDMAVGDGNNVIVTGGGKDWLFAGNGNNVVSANGGKDVLILGSGKNKIYADSPIDLSAALDKTKLAATGNARDPAAHAAYGDFFFVGNGNNTIVGGGADDYVGLGSGSNLVVLGPGNSDVFAGIQLASVPVSSDSWSRNGGENVGFSVTSTGFTAPAGYTGNFVHNDATGADVPVGLGNDTIYGGAGANAIGLSNGDNYVDAGAGNDAIRAGVGHNIIFGGAGDDTIYGAGGTNYIDGEDGNDLIVANGGTSTIEGGSGNDVIFSGDDGANWASAIGHNYIELGSGSSVVYTSGGSDTVIGGAGNASLVGGNGDLTFEGGSGTYLINGSAGRNVIYAGSGGTASQATEVDVAGGDTTVYGGSGIDLIKGGSGNDVLYAGDGGTAANPTQVVAGSGNTTIYGGAGVDKLVGGAHTTVIFAGDGGSVGAPTVVQAGSGPTTVFGGYGLDQITGGDSADVLYAGSGGTNDAPTTVMGGAGDDTLVAGAGSSLLIGGAGKNTILLNPGDGNVTAYDVNGLVQFNCGINPPDVQVSALLHGDRSSALVLRYGASTATIWGGLTSVKKIEFLDPVTLSLAEEMKQADVESTYLTGDGFDLLLSAADGDLLVGSTGNDSIYGFGAHDTLEGASGNVFLMGGGGHDKFVVASGSDATVAGSVGSDVLALSSGVLATDVTAVDLSDAVQLSFAGGTVTIEKSDGGNLALVQFADGTSATLTDLLNKQPDGDVRVEHADGTYGIVNVDAAGHLVSNNYTAGDVFIDSWIRIIDGDGTTTITHYSGADRTGTKLLDTWSKVDGTSGADTFHANGEYATRSVTDTHQVTTTNNFDESGGFVNSSVAATDAFGTRTTNTFSGPDGTGTKTADIWTTAAGGHGSDTFNADGSSFGIAYNIDGSYSTYTDDGAGTRQQDNFNAAGVKTGDAWTHADGSWGNDVFYANGTSSGTIHHPDGTYTLTTSNASGHVEQTTLSATGSVLNVTSDETTYPNTHTVTYSDGSYRVTVEDAPGVSTSTLYSASGVKQNDTWAKADGSHGVDNFYSNGARDGSTYHADGSLDVYRYDGVSQTRTTSFDANSTMTGSTVTETNGLDSITSYLSPLGVKLSETYVRADGGAGVDLVSPNDFNGFANLEQQAHLAGGGMWGSVEGPGGRSSWDGIDDGFSWWGLDWSPTNHVEIGSHYDAAGSVDLSIDQGWYQATFADPVSHVGYIEIDVGWEPGVRLGVDHDAQSWDYYIDISGVAGTVLEGYKAGTTTLGSPPNEPTPWSDGLGNFLLKNDRADVWFHNDGTYGVDWYAADGSIARGYSIEPDGKYVVFSKDMEGNVVSTVYPGSLPHTNFPAPPAPPVQVTPLARPPIDAAPGGGTGSIYSHPYTNGDYTADIVRQANAQTGQSVCDQVRTVTNADGSVQSKTVVHTDPGYDVAVAVADGFTGWTYDDAGRVTTRYFDDGQGTVVTYQYDLLGNATGKTIAVTNADGSVNSTLYDAGGALAGFMVKTFPNFGEIDTANLDGAGRATGASREFYDGWGNSIVSQYDSSGNLLGSTASVVDETGDTTTVTTYDASGNATKIIVTTGDSSGAVQTYNYDGNGHLLGSVIATPDSAGNIHTVNYDLAGGVTSYVEIVTGASGESIITTYDAHSVRVREDVLDANGVHTGTEFKADGSSVATQVQIDGSETVSEHDSSGGDTTTMYASDGTKLSLTWTSPDGSYGSETFNADGSSTGTQHDADGGHEDIVTSSTGEQTTTIFDAAGVKTGSAVMTHTGSEFGVTTYDPSGVALGERWWKPDGSFGSSDWSDSAAVYTEIHLADGTYSTGLDDRHGDVTTTYFDITGTSVGDAWTHADGSHGATTFNADGTLSGTRVDASETAISFDHAAPGVSAGQAIATQGAIIGRAWAFKVPDSAFAEADWGDTLTYSATLADGSSLPSWLAFDSQTHTFTGTPTAGAGNLNIQVTARNMEWSSARAAFTLAITQDHAPTVAHPIAAATATEDSPWTFVIPSSTFSDVDAGDVLAYSARIAGHLQLPAWLAFNAATGTFTGTPTNGNVGTTTIQVTATDLSGMAISTNFDITVLNTNDAPKVAVPIAGQSATENSPWTFAVPAGTFSDVDIGDTLTYAATTQTGAALPSWLAFNAATRTFSGTPPYVASGSLSIKVSATDSAGASAYSLFTLAVTNTDHPPVVVNSIGNQTATEDSPWSFVVPTSIFSDPDAGDTLTYSARVAGTQNLQAWMTFDGATHTFSGTPTNGFVGVKTIQVTATDASGASVSTNFDVTVLNTNDAPKVAATIGSQSTPEDSPWSFVVPTTTFTDVDVGDVLSYSAKLGNGSTLPSWLTFNAGTHTFSGTPSDPGTLTLKVIASDLAGASASTNFSLVVTAAGTAEMRPMMADVHFVPTDHDASLIGIAGPAPHLISY